MYTHTPDASPVQDASRRDRVAMDHIARADHGVQQRGVTRPTLHELGQITFCKAVFTCEAARNDRAARAMGQGVAETL